MRTTQQSIGTLLRPSQEVSAALAQSAPVVALESTIISHGLPQPRNLEVALELEEIVREAGAVPATIAVLDGVARIGLEAGELKRISTEPGLRKLGFRDLPAATALRASGATTVSATSFLAARAGIRVFATGGLGGVHRGGPTARTSRPTSTCSAVPASPSSARA
nr:hypothetical protein GCM10020093_036680 [Planobispora longispora]